MNDEIKKLFNYDVDKKYDLTDKNILCKEDVYFTTDVMQYLMDNGYNVNEITFCNAIEHCDIDLVDYLFFEKNCKFSKYSTYDAAYVGCLVLLEMFHQYNFMKLDNKGIWRYVKNNQNNFIFDYGLIEEAKQGGCPDCIEYVQDILE